MRYWRACSLVAATALLATVTVATTSRMQVSPVVRTIAVGSGPLALAVDGRTRHVFVANFASGTVSMLDAGSGAVLATIRVAPHPSAIAVAATAGRVFVISDNVTPDGAGHVSVLDAASGRLLRTVAGASAKVCRAGHVAHIVVGAYIAFPPAAASPPLLIALALGHYRLRSRRCPPWVG